ncbi:hypothetical protein ACFXPB_37210, partial [Streptomyces sp. NPDC059129]|uniref:hypothetical protein n=1 Tax=Streptomyces sp. NPDC059129 TaxID=3346734 RepID=UPI003678645D
RAQILHADISFHGKLLGSGSLTGSAQSAAFKFPGIPGVSTFTYGDLDSVREAVARARDAKGRCDVYAILIEPFSASTMTECSEAFLRGLRELCTAEDIVVDGKPRLPMPVAARIFFIGMISKFVPGRIWGVLAHLQLGRDAGVPPERMLSGFGLGLVIGVTTGAGAGILMAPVVLGAYAWLFAPLVLLAVAAFARPGWVNRLVAVVLRLARRPAVEPGTPQAVRRSILLALASWAVSGLHLWALVVLFGAPAWGSLALAVGGFSLATVAGSLAFVLPDGVGARELVLLAPLAVVMPLPAATAAVIASRLVCVLSEVAATAAALLWARLARPAPTALSRTTVPEGVR